MIQHYASLRVVVFVVAACALLAGSASGQPDKKPAKWTPETVLKLKKISNVQVSPDGKRVVYVLTTTNIDGDSSEYLSHIHLANADGSDAFQLTQGDKSCDSPQWSPDGKSIAFLSARSGKRNIWVLRVRGGEAEKLTDVKTGVASFKWSPDSVSVAYTAPDAATAEEEKAAKTKNDARVVDQNIKMVRLYVMPIDQDASGKRTARQLTPGDYSVGAALGAGPGFDWSPDGKTIAYTRTTSPAVDHWPSADIWLVNVADAKGKPLVASGAAEMSPMFSPDGSWLACVVSDNPPSWPRKARVHAVSVKGGKTRILAATPDESPHLVGWSYDGSKIFYTESFHTMTRLDALPLDGKAPPPTSLAQSVISDVNLNVSRTHFGLSRQSLIHPPEGFVSSAANFEPARITQVNEPLASLPLGKTELVNWRAKDGLNIEGLLTYPVGYQKGKLYPLLLVIHGGPAGVYSQTFIGNAYPYPIAAFAAEGYLVLRCNPRGSTGYGATFRHANVKDWGGADYQDLMAGVDHVLKMGIADEKKMGVMGWSYGGFMTSWTITQTKRFKAASVGAGVTNLASFTGTADIPSFLPSYFGGEFWNNPGVYEKHSAMWHVKNVTTPTLIQHGDKDDRVPISQGYEFYNALKRQGVATTMVVYPRMPHGPSEPRLLQDVMQRNVDWMAKYVK